MKTDLFQSSCHCWVFQICWHIECSTFTASSFRIWNSSTGIPSPPLALFVVMLPKAHLTSHSRMSGSRWVITPSWLSYQGIKIITSFGPSWFLSMTGVTILLLYQSLFYFPDDVCLFFLLQDLGVCFSLCLECSSFLHIFVWPDPWQSGLNSKISLSTVLHCPSISSVIVPSTCCPVTVFYFL